MADIRALQENGNLGFLENFAALVMNDQFGKHRRSLQNVRTHTMRDEAAVRNGDLKVWFWGPQKVLY